MAIKVPNVSHHKCICYATYFISCFVSTYKSEKNITENADMKVLLQYFMHFYSKLLL